MPGEYVFFDTGMLWRAVVRRGSPSWMYWEIEISSRSNLQQLFNVVSTHEPKITSLRDAMSRALALLALERTT